MKLKMLLKAAFRTGNFALLAGVFAVSVLTNFFVPFMLVGFAGYLYFVMQTLRSEKFIAEFNQAEKLDSLQRMSFDCNDLYKQLYRKFDKSMKTKVMGIMKQKYELIEYFNNCSKDPIRQTIVEQALKLVMAYLHLVDNYTIRSRELSSINMNDIAGRINYNNRKLGTLKSYAAVVQLTKTIELDEKLVQRMREEKEELERVSVRLDYIESTIGGFKHRIISADSMDPASEEIENVINEATALDSVLNERSKNRMRL